MLVSTIDIVAKPVQAYRTLNARPTNLPTDETPDHDPHDPLQPGPNLPAHILLGGDARTTLAGPANSGGCVAAAAGLTSSSASGVGGFFKAYCKGILLDIPLSAADGLRAVPRLYGEEVAAHETIRGWKSGAVAGGKQFVSGFSGGISDLVNQPYKGAKEEGVVGAAKGMGKGLVGFTSKVLSGECTSTTLI
ncbi:hypothetical protein IMZ48_16330 [Candidatus Bathyarchaeota archaeon]|nr:hypothetical protein [Candidatus Bathyarchaeota archaeon]